MRPDRPPALRPRWVAALVAVMLATTLAGGPSGAQDVGADDDSGTVLKARYDEVLGAEAALVTRIDAAGTRRADLLAQVADLTEQIGVQTRELAGADQRLTTATTQEERARTELAAARRRVVKATEAMHAQAVASYIHGGDGQDALTATVRAYENGDSVGRSRSYADAVLDHQRDVIREFKAARAQRDRLSKAATTARGRAVSVRDGIADTRSTLATAKVQTQLLSDQAAQQLLLGQAALSELQGKKLEIEARITGLEKESDGIGLTLAALQLAQPDFVVGSIPFANPIPEATIGSPFGLRFHPILHYTRLHSGADVSAGSGTPILAAAPGVVVIAGDRGGYGNCTVIDHGSGLATVYAHQSSIGVEPGQVVELGDVIGRVGTTGLSTGPHLHFEVRLRGVPVNPTNFITF